MVRTSGAGGGTTSGGGGVVVVVVAVMIRLRLLVTEMRSWKVRKVEWWG